MKDSKMPNDRIKCPSCGELIPITETLHRQLADEARAAVQHEVVQRQQELAAKEKELGAKESKLQQAESDLEARVAARVKAEKAKLTDSALQVARTEVAVQLQDLQKEAASKDKELKKSRDSELQLLQAKRDLQTEKDALELQVARQLELERGQIRETALKDADEAHRLKDAEKDLRLSQALKMNEDLRRKLEQGSQQIQGEVLELDLERALRNENPLDEISEVPKGVRGADLLHKVTSRTGLTGGVIIWEAKNTKNWSEGWIAKLKEDQRASKADIAVIVSDVLPKGMDGFGFKDGVWITTRRHVPALTVALRQGLMEVAQARRAVAGKNEVVEALFRYATGPEFRHRVETIAHNFIDMKEDLEAEKRQTTRRWAKRVKQLDLIIVNTAGMYGELQGLIGNQMQVIPALEGEAPEENQVTGDGLELAAAGDEEGES